MESFICSTCGVQYAASEVPPAKCIICEDERQWVRWEGQAWTTLAQMKKAGFHNVIKPEDPGESGIVGIGTQPSFAIAQRALLVQTPHGNILWDCISYLDDETIGKVKSLGGVQAISMSHPHFYGVVVEWSHAFDDAPIYLPRADQRWVTRPDPSIRYYEGVQEVFPGVTLIQTGGHFDGSAVLHWAAGGNGKAALLSGDTISVVMDRRFVSFMYSYPNNVPLSARVIRKMLRAVKPFAFDRIYGGWWGRVVASGGTNALRLSAERHIRMIQGKV